LASIPVFGATSDRAGVPAEVVSRHGALALWAIAAVLALGALIDFGVLWIGQRQPSPQWEYVAVVNTIEGMSTLVLAAALGYVAFLVGGQLSVVKYRVLAITVLVLGLVGGALGLLLATNYFVLRNGIPPEGLGAFSTTTFKSLGLSALYLLILVPLGSFGLRTAGSRKRRARR
jgi:hypothetical protein